MEILAEEGAMHRDLHNQKQGRLVVVEGIDGAGKSSVLRVLEASCLAHDRPCVVSHEPTNGPWGRKLRESARTGRLPLDEELSLFQKDRAEHVGAIIQPAINKGSVVLLDRYYFSNAAYQGARGADPESILVANERFAPQPDLVLLLDLDPKQGRSRIHGRGDVPDDFEALDALERVRQIFLNIRRPYFRRIDASRPQDEVSNEALALFEPLLG